MTVRTDPYRPIDADRPLTGRSLTGRLLLLIASLLLAPVLTTAQPDRMMDTIAQDVRVEQKLDQQVDLSLPFIDEQGDTVLLGELFADGKPVILTLVYYGCPMLCGQILEGTTRAVKQTDLKIGADYRIISISFDPTEGADLARKKKQTYNLRMKQEGTEEGWRFLTSDSASVAKLAEQVGFKYFRDRETGQYGHSSSIIVLTPSGAVSRYFFGVEYDPGDLRLGLVEASDEKIGTIADELLLLCFQYNPMTGTYGPALAKILPVAGAILLFFLVGFIVRSIRAEKRLTPDVAEPGRA